ncbi:hypothetical protein Q7P37_010988 [Cladosporium fusiforme]
MQGNSTQDDPAGLSTHCWRRPVDECLEWVFGRRLARLASQGAKALWQTWASELEPCGQFKPANRRRAFAAAVENNHSSPPHSTSSFRSCRLVRSLHHCHYCSRPLLPSPTTPSAVGLAAIGSRPGLKKEEPRLRKRTSLCRPATATCLALHVQATSSRLIFRVKNTACSLPNMAFSSYRGPQSPQDSVPFPGYASNPLSPPRNSNRLSAGMLGSTSTTGMSETRAGLTRRFTTNALPTLSPIGQQRRQAAGETPQNGTFSRLSPEADIGEQSEQKYRHYEQLLAEQRRIQAYIAEVDPDTRREVDDHRRHEDAVAQMIAQSEPTTPPEYADAFPSIFSKPNRYSSASLTSPPGIVNRPTRAATQLTSPPFQYSRPLTSSANLPSHSMPGSRRQSDDEEEADDYLYNFDSSLHRAAANPNRNSMPVTSHDRKRSDLPDLSSVLGPVNTTSFLFDDEDRPVRPISKSTQVSPSDGRSYLQVQHTADGFPKLIRREENGAAPFANPAAALDLALSQANGEQQPTDRATASRHRISLPPSALRNNDINIAGIGSVLAAKQEKPAANNRRSVEFNLATEPQRPSLRSSPPRGLTNGSTVSSYSTNDIPTLKSINGVTSPLKSAIKPANQGNSSTSTIHENDTSAGNSNSNGISNGNDSSDHIPQNVTSPAQAPTEHDPNGNEAHTSFQANAQPFNPALANNPYQQPFPQVMPPPQFPHFYGPPGPYGMPNGMHGLANNFSHMGLNGGFPGQPQFPPFDQSPYGGFQQPYAQAQAPAVGGAPRGSNAQFGSNGPHRRQGNAEDSLARFNNVNFEDLKPEILALCTDQHGCRFLQRKLDERDEATVKMIFEEVHPSIVKLMTDPFGNYLCQKLLENCNDEQRTVLIGNCMENMTQIALNQHGTRALQKMIEYVSTPQQTQMIIDAMRYDVVQLIQDLNGNHVIQKCLNHLNSTDAQFIFDAVGVHCVPVGTHRHGCCVLQRCVDHASGAQKAELVRQISTHAFSLVQDPFGNYVVQYILDLGQSCFIEPLCQHFQGSVVLLSKQKFSSNVIEKCIRVAGAESRRLLIQEITPAQELEKLLRDSFANYVVQTAFDLADDDQKVEMANNLRPILPTIRHTPYGRRLQSKIQDFDARWAGFNATSGGATPEDTGIASPQQAFAPSFGNFQNARGNRQGFVGPAPQFFGQHNQAVPNGNADIASPKPQRMSGNLGDKLDAQSTDALNGGRSAHSNRMPSVTYDAVHRKGYRSKMTSEQPKDGVPAHQNSFRYY